ncbi:MAG: hypothetical protein HPY73_06165 [Methanomassiliicoccales archaeon]|nr:MAG: hypothetical protein HPY73_06165 [Methanomassiliicoccales archaeon]
MSFDWKIMLIVWLILGIASSMLVYWDMDRRKKVQGTWALLCIPLSVLGLGLYLVFRNKIQSTGRELPPKPDYGKPEYVFKEEPKVEKVPDTVEEKRLDAPSSQPGPIKDEDKKDEEVVLPEPPPVQARAEWKEDAPVKRERIEGIPRCPRCNAAVSSFDAVCSDCGAKLK